MVESGTERKSICKNREKSKIICKLTLNVLVYKNIFKKI